MRQQAEVESDQEKDGISFFILVEENDLMANQRGELLMKNEKFMKEIRKKFEDKKKAEAEAAAPKRKVEVVVKKPVEEEEAD